MKGLVNLSQMLGVPMGPRQRRRKRLTSECLTATIRRSVVAKASPVRLPSARGDSPTPGGSRGGSSFGQEGGCAGLSQTKA